MNELQRLQSYAEDEAREPNLHPADRARQAYDLQKASLETRRQTYRLGPWGALALIAAILAPMVYGGLLLIGAAQ